MSDHHTEKKPSSQEFRGVHLIEKTRGETLAMLLDRFRELHNLDHRTKLTYAGRLDPMAEGLVIILAGEDRFQKDTLLGLDKEYVVEVLLGVGTDSLDPLGRIHTVAFKHFEQGSIATVVKEMENITVLPYPVYSSVPVAGAPLFVHARAGKQVDVPLKKVKIYEAQIENIRTENLKDLVEEIVCSVQKVMGDFRQQETVVCWQELLKENSDQQITLVRLRIRASSGTYMRVLAQWLGEQLGVPALAYMIRRTKIGDL